jgi:hypothetical protein
MAKVLITGTLKKFGKSIMECLYKFLYLNINEWSTHKLLRWMNMGSQFDLRNLDHKDEPWVLASTVGQLFYILDLKDGKKHIIVHGKQRVVRVDNMKDEKEYNQFDEVPFFVDTTGINIIEIKISYSNVIPYMHTDGERKLIHV